MAQVLPLAYVPAAIFRPLNFGLRIWGHLPGWPSIGDKAEFEIHTGSRVAGIAHEMRILAISFHLGKPRIHHIISAAAFQKFAGRILKINCAFSNCLAHLSTLFPSADPTEWLVSFLLGVAYQAY